MIIAAKQVQIIIWFGDGGGMPMQQAVNRHLYNVGAGEINELCSKTQRLIDKIAEREPGRLRQASLPLEGET